MLQNGDFSMRQFAGGVSHRGLKRAEEGKAEGIK
jgi:hypothetical protein